MSTTFITYYQPEHGKPFEVEHIWADKYERYSDEFEQEHEFNNYRNRLGDLVYYLEAQTSHMVICVTIKSTIITYKEESPG